MAPILLALLLLQAQTDLSGVWDGRMDFSKPDGVATMLIRLTLTQRGQQVIGSWTSTKATTPHHGTITGRLKAERGRQVFDGTITDLSFGDDTGTVCAQRGRFSGPTSGDPVTWTAPRGYDMPDKACANPFGAVALSLVRADH